MNKNPSLAWGGPNPGSSPYTVVAYLRKYGEVGDLKVQSLGGREYYHLTFSPALQRVAALDAAQERAVAVVQSVKGDIWIDKDSRMPYQEQVIVKSKGPEGNEETVDMSLLFSDYNKPVEIKIP